jgi:glycosyltransferase involved in cell wall biosynthesis
MHVGLNCIFLVPGESGGMDIYARELMAALSGVRVTAFVGREAAHEDFPVETVVVPVRATNRGEWVRGEQLLLPRLAMRAGVDVLHSLASTAPGHGRFARVVTIHDLHHRIVPEAHFGIRGLGLRVLVSLAARRSHRVIAVSASTRDDLVSLLRMPANRIDVIPSGPGQGPRAQPLPEDALRERLGLRDRPVVLSLSAKRPHKNLSGLLRALALIEPARRPVAVLPGYWTPHEAELKRLAAALGVAEDVRFCGWIPAADLEGLFALARGLVFPSLYEGFGLPVLEAMARGIPVACSERASLTEVAGDAALLFDPEEPAGIAEAVRRLVGDEQVRERLIASGRARVARYSWTHTARETLATYQRALAAAA